VSGCHHPPGNTLKGANPSNAISAYSFSYLCHPYPACVLPALFPRSVSGSHEACLPLRAESAAARALARYSAALLRSQTHDSRHTDCIGGMTMSHIWQTVSLRYLGFMVLVGLLILLSGNTPQPAQAQTVLPNFTLVGNAVRHENRWA
jgi:hypothetical protein